MESFPMIGLAGVASRGTDFVMKGEQGTISCALGPAPPALSPSSHSLGRWQATAAEVRGRDPLGPWSTPMQLTMLPSTVGR
jgi:hypothetical protein